MHLTGTRARDPHEPHRAATPLELLFDLTFVVAVAAVVPQLAADKILYLAKACHYQRPPVRPPSTGRLMPLI